MAADKVVQVKNKYEDGSSTDTTTKNVLVGETSTTYTQAPDAATQAFVEQQMTPVAQSMGIDPNTRKVVTPFEVIGYNPEKERQRREAERLLNERKKKESGWYNALSIVGDALTAAHGGNVWRREANRTAAQSEKDNQRLIAEQKAEDVYNREKLRNQELAYAKMLNDAIHPYLTKTTVKDKDYEQQTETTVHGAKSGYKMDAFKVNDSSNDVVSDENGMYDSNGNYTGKDGKKIAITINKDPNNIHTNDYIVSPKDYDIVLGVIKQRYADLLKNGSPENQVATEEFLKSIGVVYDEKRGRFSDEDQLLQNGRYLGLDDNTRKKILEKTGGRVKFTQNQPTYWKPSSTNKQPRNDAE